MTIFPKNLDDPTSLSLSTILMAVYVRPSHAILLFFLIHVIFSIYEPVGATQRTLMYLRIPLRIVVSLAKLMGFS